ncbi:MAG: type I methionyl aminopeptidase [Acidimicrobiales bacterium]
MVELKTGREVEAMRAAGKVVADALAAVRDQAAVCVRLSELDQVARDVLARAGATSPFLGYQPSFAATPFPAVICTSVNDVALHGLPGRYRLVDGDLLSVDCGTTLHGWTGDAAISFIVGHPREADLRLIETAQDALRAGIAAAVVGAKLGDITAAIGAVGRAAGYGINTDYGGHGIGRTMHEAPSVPNEGRPGRGRTLKPGFTIAIEPWFLSGGDDAYRIDSDGWYLRSGDGSRAAHVEHTIAITDDGPLILTAV